MAQVFICFKFKNSATSLKGRKNKITQPKKPNKQNLFYNILKCRQIFVNQRMYFYSIEFQP